MNLFHFLNRLFGRKSKKTSKLRVTGLCAGNSPGTGESPHKWPLTRRMFPFDDVTMSYLQGSYVTLVLESSFQPLLTVSNMPSSIQCPSARTWVSNHVCTIFLFSKISKWCRQSSVVSWCINPRSGTRMSLWSFTSQWTIVFCFISFYILCVCVCV